MPQVHEALAGRYELVGVLARGGMGIVYRACDRVLDRRVVVKVLPSDRADDPEFVARFEREALAVAALSHPNIVAIFDSGEDDGTHFIVMECVHGESLARLLQRRRSVSARRTVAIGTQIAAALAAAHRAGIIHRDVKPANVMIAPDGHVKVLDFGIARARASAALTETSVVLGSAPYIAPEVSRGQPADERSDIYSLGCVLYELLAGRPPFTGDLPEAILHQQVASSPAPLGPGVPKALAAAVMRMLAKAPDDRPASAREVQSLLRSALDVHRPSRAAPLPPVPAPGAGASSEPTQPTALLPRRPATSVARSRLAPLLGVTALLVLVGALALALRPSLPAPRTSGRAVTRPAVQLTRVAASLPAAQAKATATANATGGPAGQPHGNPPRHHGGRPPGHKPGHGVPPGHGGP